MYDDLVLVLTCETSERIAAMRGLLDSPTRAKGSVAVVAQGLHAALDDIVAGLALDIFPALRRGNITFEEAVPLARKLSNLGDAVRAVHRRLGHLSLRWAYSGPDIVTRKLREDGAAVVMPAICPSDEYDCIDDDVTSRLAAELRESGVAVRSGGQSRRIILLPRSEGANPLAWARLLGPLAHRIVREQGLLERLRPQQGEVDDLLRAVCVVQSRLGGPSAFAAEAAHALFMGSAASERLALLGACVREEASALALEPPQQTLFKDDLVTFYGGLLRVHASLLGKQPLPERASFQLGEFVDVDQVAPPASLPLGSAAATLFAKLDAGVPINAVGATVGPDFAARLDACTDAAGFYGLVGEVAERPASVATILSLGWLHKAQRDYALFRDLVQAAPRDGTAAARVLATYGQHAMARGHLLQQSLEAAHVHQIFAKWGGKPR